MDSTDVPPTKPKLHSTNPHGGDLPADAEPGWVYSPVYTRGKSYACTILAESTGGEFADGSTCQLGTSLDSSDLIEVSDVKLREGDKRTLEITVLAALSAQTGKDIGWIKVIDPDGSAIRLDNCFTIV